MNCKKISINKINVFISYEYNYNKFIQLDCTKQKLLNYVIQIQNIELNL